MNPEINPVENQIESLTGGSLANKVPLPEQTNVPVTPDTPQEPISDGLDLQEPQQIQQQAPIIPEQPQMSAAPVLDTVQQTLADLNVVAPNVPEMSMAKIDPTSYRRQRFEKVDPYVVTMPNGDQFITTSLDPEKIQYEYYAHKRDNRAVMDLESYARERNDVSYFGYYPMSSGIKESLAGAAGRGFVNFFTNSVADAIGLAAIVSTMGMDPEDQLNVIESVRSFQNDVTAHPTNYWVDVERTGMS